MTGLELFRFEDSEADAKLNGDRARAASAFTGFEVAEVYGDVLGGWLVGETEGLGLAFADAPHFVILQGEFGKDGYADIAAIRKFVEL